MRVHCMMCGRAIHISRGQFELRIANFIRLGGVNRNRTPLNFGVLCQGCRGVYKRWMSGLKGGEMAKACESCGKPSRESRKGLCSSCYEAEGRRKRREAKYAEDSIAPLKLINRKKVK